MIIDFKSKEFNIKMTSRLSNDIFVVIKEKVEEFITSINKKHNKIKIKELMELWEETSSNKEKEVIEQDSD